MPAKLGDGVPPNLSLRMVEEKEAELASRREELHRLQSRLAPQAAPEPNFPPEFLCIKPLVYHDIKAQVPVHAQRFMYALAFAYFALVALIVNNVSAALLSFVFGGSGIHFALSLIYLVGIPGAFVVWYYNVYSSVVAGTSLRRQLSYFGLCLGVIFDGWMAVGVGGLGGCGWLMAFGETNSFVFIVAVISACLWTAHCVLLLILLIKFCCIPTGSSDVDNTDAEQTPKE